MKSNTSAMNDDQAFFMMYIFVIIFLAIVIASSELLLPYLKGDGRPGPLRENLIKNFFNNAAAKERDVDLALPFFTIFYWLQLVLSGIMLLMTLIIVGGMILNK